MPAVLPPPGDLLELDAQLTERLDRIRWTMRTGPFVGTLINHLVDDPGEPQESLTFSGPAGLCYRSGRRRRAPGHRGACSVRRCPRAARPGAGRGGTTGNAPALPPRHGLRALSRAPAAVGPRGLTACRARYASRTTTTHRDLGNSASGKSTLRPPSGGGGGPSAACGAVPWSAAHMCAACPHHARKPEISAGGFNALQCAMSGCQDEGEGPASSVGVNLLASAAWVRTPAS